MSVRAIDVRNVDRYLRTPDLLGGPSPVTPGPNHVPHTFFVDATNGADTNGGEDPRFPLATVQAAIDKTSSGRGDVIFVYPGSYDENLSTDALDYVHIIGIITGYGRPDIVPTTGVALDTGSAQGLYCENIRFYSADADAVIQRGNGFAYKNCVFDGDTGQAATEANFRLKGVTDDDSYTASEGLLEDCLVRNSNGFGVAFDVGTGAGNQVGATDNVFRRVRFVACAQEDVKTVDTSAGGAYSAKNNIFDECSFLSRNKATHIDLDTTNGAANTGNVFQRCFIFDDTVDGTAVKIATANAGLIGCFGLDGVIDGDALD